MKLLKRPLLFLTLLFLFCGSGKAYAETYNYKISDAEFIDETESDTPAVYGTWNGAIDTTNYTVKLYKGTKLISSRVLKAETIDFSTVIIMKAAGAGTYSFTVTTTKGGNSISSDTLKITSSMVTLMRNRIYKERKAARAASGGGWEKGPGNIWTYYDSNGEQVKNRWLDIDGQRYYFDSNGIMLTGWHYLNKKYYYLEPKGNSTYPLGAMWRSATTPDGHEVDENGARLGDMTTAPETTENVVKVLNVYLKEQQTAGEYSKILGITCGSGTVSNILYNSDPNTWTYSKPGVVTFDVELTEGLKVATNLKVNCSRASSVVVTQRSFRTLKIELHYIPRFLLKAPENFMITPEGKISWEKVTKAASYKVNVTAYEEDDSGEPVKKTRSYTTKQPYFDLMDNGYYEDTEIVSVYVQAIGSNKKIVTSSALASLGDLTDLRIQHSIAGEFTRTSVGLKYVDENGEDAVGWKLLAGSWYYFKANGYAAGPGWYQAEDQNWYYFDEYNRMVTGKITENGVTYNLNDGSDTSRPAGALIE